MEQQVGPVEVVVVDGHPVFRLGVRAALADADDIRVVAEAGDGVAALEAVEATRPHVLLLGLRLRGPDGVEVCFRVRAAWPDTAVMVLTDSSDGDDLVAALRAGARGYVLKDAEPEEVRAAVRAVAAGRTVVSPSLTPLLVAGYTGEDDTRLHDPVTRLTVREREVLSVLGEGATNREIAARLFISENTVKNHVHNILEKLGSTSRTEAALTAARLPGRGRV